MKKIIIIAASLLICMAASAQKLVILHVNDTHSHFEPERMGPQIGHGGVIERAAIVDSVRAARGKKHVLLLHAGDFSQGSPYFTMFKGDLEVDCINAEGYDAVTIGNHEFDNGVPELVRRCANMKCPVVCANYDFSQFDPTGVIKPYTIIKRGGKKIGIIGLLCDISTVVEKKNYDGVKVLDTFAVANKWADYLKNEKHCDLVIALSHLGYGDRGLSDGKLVENTRNIDLVIGGHTHTYLKEMKHFTDLDGKQVPVVQVNCWGRYIGEIYVD